MTRGLVNLLASSLIITGTVGAALVPTSYAQSNIDEDITVRVYQVASPAVVSIRAGSATGSGSIIDSKGLVLTNGHVVRNSNNVTVILANKQRLQGRVISRSLRDPDLALIQLQNVTGNLPKINVISSSQVKVGQRAFAIGDPFGQFAGTLTTGIISRIDSDRKLLQTDAAINPGNSGGPLLNSRGELIGVNTLIFTPGEGNVGLGFAINADTVRQFISSAPRRQLTDSLANNNPAINPPTTTNTFPLDGSARAFNLTPNDLRASDGSAFKSFRFSAKEGQRLSIEMNSRDLNPYLALVDPRGRRIAVDDNSGTARIRVVIPSSGTYTLFANSSDAGEYGRFTLSARLDALNNPRSNSGEKNSSEIILQRSSILGANSSILPRDGSLYETFSFAGRAGQKVQIEVNSLDFRPSVALVSPDRRVVKVNDGTGQNAAITVQLPSSGTYRVIANAFDSSGRGNYTVTVRNLD